MLRYCLLAAVSVWLSFGQVQLSVLKSHAAPKGEVRRLSSSVLKTDSSEPRAHTNIELLEPTGGKFAGKPLGIGQEPFELFNETPASIACVYELLKTSTAGQPCNPDKLTTTDNPTGGSKTIVLVDAYDHPYIQADLDAFCKQFGLPATKVDVVFAGGTRPPQDPTGGWELEESLDVEWSHAMAPKAKIVLIEVQNESLSTLMGGVVLANEILAKAGGGEVSMSWGYPECSGPSYCVDGSIEATYDPVFTQPGVVYFASAGDVPGTIYPSVSPNVISAGGTSLSRDPASGDFLVENTWQEAGGGLSLFESQPIFQNPIGSIVQGSRGTPDISFDANPITGVWIYDCLPADGLTGPWFVVGGTSVSSPSLAGIVNSAGRFAASSVDENTTIYNDSNNSNTADITYGNCYFNSGLFAVPGWDFCTGIGAPRTYNGR